MAFVPPTEHTVTRPSWDCRVCGQPWPCANAKIDLVEEYARFPTALIIYLSIAFDEAGGDLVDADGHFPVDLLREVPLMGDGVGDESARVLALSEAQYKFGSGPVLCRSIEVIAPVIFDNEHWWHVRAECAYGTRERHGGWHHRELYLIASVVGVQPRDR